MDKNYEVVEFKNGEFKLDVSVTGQNLGYITSANVASPEVSTAGSGYALPRTLLFGVNVTF